jgi:hypothetical protein
MAIEFKEEHIVFDRTAGSAQREPFTATFSRNIRTAEAVLKGFNIKYSNGDHHLLQQQIDIDITSISNNSVKGSVDFILRDSSGHYDDPYEGWVQIVIIADLK